MKLLFPIFLIFTSFYLLSQRKKTNDTSTFLIQKERIDFMYEEDDEEYIVINGRNDGLMVAIQTSVKQNQNYTWKFLKLDTALKITTNFSKSIPLKYELIGWDYSYQNYYLLFSTKNYNYNEFSIFKISPLQNEIEEIKINTIIPIGLNNFDVVRNIIIFNGHSKNRPVTMTIDLKDKKPKITPGIYNDDINSEVVDINIDEMQELYSVSLRESTPYNWLTISIKTFTLDNLIIQNNYITNFHKKNLIDGASSSFLSGFQLIAGTYSEKNEDYCQGLYLAKFANEKQQFIKFYNFSELENFFSYLGEKKEMRIKNKIEKKRKKGKTKKFNYKILIHNMIEKDDHFILIGESYTPHYHRPINYFGDSRFYTETPFTTKVTYEFTHAIIVAFDTKGNLLWDHSFPLEDISKENLGKNISVNVTDNQIELVYLEKNLLRSKIIKEKEIIEGKTYNQIKTAEGYEFTISNPEDEYLEKWFGDCLIAYGYQKVKKIDRKTYSKSLDIFYINKIRFLNKKEL